MTIGGPRECMRGGFCNFMHLKPISYELRRELYNRRHSRSPIESKPKRHFKKKKRRKPKKRKALPKISSPESVSSLGGEVKSNFAEGKEPEAADSAVPLAYRPSYCPPSPSSASESDDAGGTSEVDGPEKSLPLAFRNSKGASWSSSSSGNESPAEDLLERRSDSRNSLLSWAMAERPTSRTNRELSGLQFRSREKLKKIAWNNDVLPVLFDRKRNNSLHETTLKRRSSDDAVTLSGCKFRRNESELLPLPHD